MKIIAQLTFLIILISTISLAADRPMDKEHTTTSGIEMLSVELRELLATEMQALQTGMMSIIPAYISGDWRQIETIAANMKDSYVLKQNLSEAQLEELHSVMPSEFIMKDQKFHYLAGMLEHAAKNKKSELVNFYFSEMNESCISCHAAFATHKFPALAPQSSEGHNH